MPIRYLLLLLTFCIFALPLKAAEINDTGINTLKALFQAELDRHQKTIENGGGVMTVNGAPLIEKADTYYAVTLPEMTIIHASGLQTKLGLTAINAVPTDNPDKWKMSVSLPSPIIYRNDQNEPVMDIHFDRQRMGGLWDLNFGGFSQLSASYHGVKIRNTHATLNIEEIKFSGGLNIHDSDHLDFTNKIQISGIESGAESGVDLLQDIFPHTVNLNWQASQVPFQNIHDIIMNLNEQSDNPTAQRLAVLQALMRLPKTLSEADTALKINEFKAGNDVYNVQLDTDLNATANSILGFTGTINIIFENLDKLKLRLKTHQKNATPSQIDQIETMTKRINSLQALSQSDGTQDTYKIVLDEDGRITVNDKDVGALLMSAL